MEIYKSDDSSSNLDDYDIILFTLIFILLHISR